MSSNVDQSETVASWTPDSLRERVEELAAKLVLGDTGGEQWATLLAGVRQQAETAGRGDVARIAAESLAAWRARRTRRAAKPSFLRVSRACSRPCRRTVRTRWQAERTRRQTMRLR